MAARKPLARNNHLEEAMALLIRNQAAFVEQIARNDQERLKLQIKGEDWMRRTEEWQRKTEEWQQKAEVRFDRIEQRLASIEASLIQLPKTILAQLPKAVKKEIGFKSLT
jgi:5-formaminoimidazole-4-carboxamide-1-beta-D-ribofuranosyl 5'-monophosphate synthetase